MATLRERIAERLAPALAAAGFPDLTPEVSPTADPRFGDYQTNAALLLAKQARANPRQVATRIIEQLQIDDLCAPPEIAGAGFINFRVLDEVLAVQAGALLADGRCGAEPVHKARRIIVDFSSPNVAKPMHVGHIRSTILGDCLVRVARFLGHEVIADNHIGDWGTQFGKVIYGWKHFLDREALAKDPIAELVRLYRDVNALEVTEEEVKAAAREELVKLQAGDVENLAIWRETVDLSWQEFRKVYDLLDIHFDETLGESAYNEALAPLCERLEQEGVAEPSQGALCIFFRDIEALAEKPAIIRKGDGGFLYATTDLATIEYRVHRWHPDAVWYVVGMPQSLHFQQIFAAARRIGVTAQLEHIPFGSILGEDRKIMRTRSGENVGLVEVLAEGLSRAHALVSDKNPDLSDEEKEEIGRMIGLGAIKYAELSQHRMTDYVFSWDKMLSFQGNTAPYLQNAYVRIRSIFRKAEGEVDFAHVTLLIQEKAERDLALKLLQFGEIVPLVLDDYRPNLLANYLYELASHFHAFFESCPVLKSEEPLRSSRLLFCELTARTLKTGLGLLGIKCPERM